MVSLFCAQLRNKGNTKKKKRTVKEYIEYKKYVDLTSNFSVVKKEVHHPRTLAEKLKTHEAC